MIVQYSNGWILVPEEATFASSVYKLQGATTIHRGIAVPAIKINFMAIEAMGAFTASDEYVDARRVAFATAPEDLEKARALLKKWSIDPKDLLDHQLQYVAERWDKPCTFNASEPGTGKTLETLIDLRIKGVSRVLLVGPRDVVSQWGEEIRDRRIDFLFHPALTGDREARLRVMKEADDYGGIFGINYQMLDSLEPELRKVQWEAIVLDEGYCIKAHNGSTSKAAWRLSKTIPNRIILNGTPIGNGPQDFYAQIRFLFGADKFVTYKEFCDTYVQYVTTHAAGREIKRAIGCSDPVKLMYLLEPLWVRATKETCLDLPPLFESTEWFDMPTEMKEMYEKVVVSGEQALGRELSLADERVVMLRLQQICGGHIPIFDTRIEQVEGEDEEISGFCYEPIECSKLRWLINYIDALCGNDPTRRVIVWCRFDVEVLRITRELRALLGDPAVAYVNRTVTTAQLDEIKALFNSRREDTVRVVVAQIAKMYNGHNMQAGDVHIHYNHTWSHIMKSQSGDRSHRHGRLDSINIINLAYRNSIDQGALGALSRKEDMMERMSPETIGVFKYQ